MANPSPIMYAVAKSDVRARVDEDIADGRPEAAARRLRILLAAAPRDIEVYRLLAQVYRQAGNLVEAGRWGFVTTDVTREELSAFERAYPSPWIRLRQLGWTATPDHLPDLSTRQRMRVLTAMAELTGPPAGCRGPLGRGGRHRKARLVWLLIAAGVVAVGVASAVGLARIV